MKIPAVFALLLLAIASTPANAAGKGNHSPAFHTIVEVDASSITVRLGATGDKKQTLKITDVTKVTLNGAPAAARDLMAGMSARLRQSADPAIADSIAAKNAQLRHKR